MLINTSITDFSHVTFADSVSLAQTTFRSFMKRTINLVAYASSDDEDSAHEECNLTSTSGRYVPSYGFDSDTADIHSENYRSYHLQ